MFEMKLCLEMVTKITKFLECMHAMVGSQYNRKTIRKNGAMLHYITVLLWIQAECMPGGTVTSRKKRYR